MKAVFKLDENLTFEVSAENQSDMFEELARLQEVFGDRTVRSKDGKVSENVRFQVRTDKEDNKYYELVCVDFEQPDLVFARRQYGCHKKGGGLFPKNRGHFVKWNKDDQCEYDLLTGEKVEKANN